MWNELPSLNRSKREQISLMFFTVKILALLFSVIPILEYFSLEHSENEVYSIYYIGMIFIMFSLIMLFLMFIFNRKERHDLYYILEISIFMIVFIASIYISGAHESENKYIFLFLIISYTIEHGMKAGIIISGIATAVIATMDLILGNNATINVQFENDLALFAMFFLVAWTIGHYARLEQKHIKELVDYANIDGLTGAYNHRYFYEIIERLFEEHKKKGTHLSLVMMDLDYFKKYNDIYGHAQGDAFLKEITGVIQSSIREKDILCRYGGDEF